MAHLDREDASRLAAAIAAARAPLPRGLSEQQLLDALSIQMGGIFALGGWLVRSGFNDRPNPRIHETPDGQRIRHRVRKIEECLVVVRRGDKPRGPCPMCKHPYEYELYPGQRDFCQGCAKPCGLCGIEHRQAVYGSSAYECIKALAARVRKLEARPTRRPRSKERR